MSESTDTTAETLDDAEATQQEQLDEALSDDDQAEESEAAETTDDSASEQAGGEAGHSAPLDESLLDQAESLGIDRSTATALGSNEAIEALLEAVNHDVRRAGREQTQQPQPKNNGAARSQDTSTDTQLPELKLDLSADEIGETAQKALQKFAGDVGDQLKAIRDERDALRQEVAQAKGIATQASGDLGAMKFSHEVDSLGEDWTELFGKGDIRPGTKQFANREKLAEGMYLRLEGLKATNRPRPTMKALFVSSLASEFPRKANKIAEKAAKLAAQDRHSQVIGKPSSSRPNKSKKGLRQRSSESLDKLAKDNPELRAFLQE